MNDPIKAWAAVAPDQPLQAFEYDPGPLGPEDVEVQVEHCGICHSDLSMVENEWRRTQYPLVPGHEVVGRVVALGPQAKGLQPGQRVGIGWISGSCQWCRQCLGGDQHLCARKEETIVGRYGGFADRVRAHWSWAVPLPEGLAHDVAGPLFCGGITVFTPILEHGVQSTHRVGVVGIGGLGHLALQFLNKWGCEVTAFTSSDSKREEALRLGAHHAVASNDKAAIKALARRFDFILVTVNVALDWPAYLAALGPRGRLHFVGAVLEPLNLSAGALIAGQKSVGGSPVGSPAVMAEMLEFCARHDIRPQVEAYRMDQVNEALDRLRSGKARYRVILQA